jgi:hypothetical protein
MVLTGNLNRSDELGSDGSDVCSLSPQASTVLNGSSGPEDDLACVHYREEESEALVLLNSDKDGGNGMVPDIDGDPSDPDPQDAGRHEDLDVVKVRKKTRKSVLHVPHITFRLHY